MSDDNELQDQKREDKNKKSKNTFGFGVSKKIFRTLGLLVLGGIIFFVVFQFVGWNKILSSIRQLNLTFFTLAMVCIFASISIWTARWNLFIKERGYDVSFFSLFKYMVVGLAVNNMTPLAKFGGEPVRAYLLKNREGIRMREGFATVVAELSMMFFVLVGMVILSFFLFFLLMSPPSWIIFLLIPFGALVFFMFFLIRSIYSGGDSIIKFLGWLGRKVERIKPYRDKIEKVYKEFREAFRRCLKNRRVFTEAFALSIFVKVFDIAKFFFLFKALGYGFGVVEIVIVMGLNIVLLSIPATPGSLGVVEGGLISLLAFLNVPAQVAASVVFLDRLVWFWIITAVGGTLGTHYGVSILESKATES